MTVLPAEALRPWEDLAVPAGLSNLPARPGLFVGRAHELARLDAALAGPGGAVVQAVHGLGGVGEGTVAARWAVAHAADYLRMRFNSSTDTYLAEITSVARHES